MKGYIQTSHLEHSRIDWHFLAAGFTLLELLISMFVITIITFFALPNTSALYKKNQLQTVTAEIQKAIQTGKIQSLSRGESLVLAPISNSKDWSKGMLLFVDNVKHQYTPEVKLVYQWKWNSTGVSVSWQGAQSNNYLLFTADLKSSITNGTFIVGNNIEQVKLIVNRLARVRNA